MPRTAPPILGRMPIPRVGRCVRAAAITTLLLALTPAVAAGEPYPVPQHVSFGADWTEGLRPEDLSPSRAVTCIVDSGTAITPDTPPDNQAGPVVLRTSVDGSVPAAPPSDGGAVADHGTYMAAAAIAPRNSWGTVGLEPLGRVASVRALPENSQTFSIDDLQRGIGRCLVLTNEHVPIAAISLSLSKVQPSTQAEQAEFSEVVRRVRRLGIAVVAAAGDEALPGTGWPAAAPSVIAVTAAGQSGSLCSYSPRDERVDIAGPGCDVLEPASLVSGESVIDDAAGSSTAAVWVAQAITLLCDLAPSLTGSDAGQVILDSARAEGPVPRLDLAAAAQAVGAANVVSTARRRLAPDPGGAQASPLPGAPAGRPRAKDRPKRLVVGSVKTRWRRPALAIAARGREAGGVMRVRVYRGTRSRRVALRTARVRSGRTTMRLRRRPTFVGVQMLPASRSSRLASRIKVVRVGKHTGSGR
jgi:hypothetical protein